MHGRHPNKLEADTMKKLATSWFQSHGGEQSGSTAILDEGMTFKEIAVKLVVWQLWVLVRDV